ncbi:Anaphase-promoting complex subunit 1 [Coemansia javaensis]|uniref:Anaphase-promoting complex subunit 1 n=1 Tax=Coemansia javaensis TaxID=2761396 RepID=A0A9W8HCQ4_9FUNG|nr:Anaphase-promoting complex subunit 1 [Coemansia javaensis]
MDPQAAPTPGMDPQTAPAAEGPGVLAATLDDLEGGWHGAYTAGASVVWTLNGRFVRRLQFDAAADVEHVVFARFGGEDGAAAQVALCVFQVDSVGIHYRAGEGFRVALPFSVCSVHALHSGLLVQRRTTAAAAGADGSDGALFGAQLPTLFSLLGPRSEFKMLGLSRDLDQARQREGRALVLSPTPPRAMADGDGGGGGGGGGAIPVFNEPAVVLVGVAASRHNAAAQFVLCWDAGTRRHLVYQCTVMGPAADGVGDGGDGGGGGGGGGGLAETPAAAAAAFASGSGSDSGAGQLAATRPRLARQASLSVQRRASVAASAAAKRRSGYTSAVKNDRRSSMLGRVSFGDSPGPSYHYAADVFREQRRMRAEAVLRLCWTGRPAQAMDAAICVVQAPAGRSVVCVLVRAAATVVGLDAATFDEEFRHPARAMAPVRAAWPGMDDLLIVSPAGAPQLVVGGGGGGKPVPLPRLCAAPAAGIAYTRGEWAALDTRGGLVVASTRVRISRLALAACGALSCVLSRAAYAQLWRSAVASLAGVQTAAAEIERLVALVLHGSDRGSPAVTLPARAKAELRDRAPAALYALRLVYEDAALCRSEPPARLAAVGELLVRFASQHGLAPAHAALLRTGLHAHDRTPPPQQPLPPPAPSSSSSSSSSSRQRAADRGPAICPSFTRWALAALAGGSRPAPFYTLAQTGTLFGISDAEPAWGAHGLLRLLGAVADMLYQLAAARDAALVLRRLAADPTPQILLQQLAPDMHWLVTAVVARLQRQCHASWPPAVLALLGRHDVVANAGLGPLPPPPPPHARFQQAAQSQEPGPRTVTELCDEAVDHAAQAGAAPRLAARAHEFSQLAFSRDLRLDEAERLLDTSAAVHTTTDADAPGDGGGDDASSPKARFLDALSRRVLALPPGQSLLRYSTRELSQLGAFAIARPEVAARFRGQKTAAVWDRGEADVGWPLFHSGVAAALSIERDQLARAHPSWVLLNWPAEPALEQDPAEDSDAQRAFADALALHAGFLLGMGLLPRPGDGPEDAAAAAATAATGPLCNMPPWQAFKYLSRRHGLTSIALLLGCACAHRGSMSGSVSKILSLHIPVLLPPGSSELMLLSYGTQAAAMLGLGLLFMRSQNRRMVEVMLHELAAVRAAPQPDAPDCSDPADPTESTAECYSLAAGFALGLVVLGRGMSARALADLNLLDSLSEAIAGPGAGPGTDPCGPASGAAAANEAVGMLGRMSISGGHVSSLGAIAAVGLVFLGTNYAPAAQRLALPQEQQHLRATDPFVVLWKTLMRALIMLDHVQPTREWVESAVPRACRPPADGQPLPPDLCRIRLHAVAAACFAVALKYVGTEDQRAHATILARFDEAEAIVARPALGYEPSLTRAAAQSCLDALCIAAALVVAGSGDIATMQRLRVLHGASPGRTYGNHMASHMALGILFLGGGARFTMGRSPESMALLLVSLFPRFPQHFADNREHLQAWRHLWALCVVPRCLAVRDVVTGDMCQGAVVTLTGLLPDGAARSADVVPPTPFPSLAGVQAAAVAAPGYLPLRIDLSPRSHARSLLLRRRVLYMQPLPAAEDAPLQRYLGWLAETKALVARACERLARADYIARSPGEDAASVVRAVERLRVCVLASRRALAAHPGGDRQEAGDRHGGAWAEETYLAWLSVRGLVLTMGRSDAVRRMLARYWTGGSQQPEDAFGSAAAFACIGGLLHAALDPPTPADAMELAKRVPVSQLVDHVLGGS